MNKVLALTLCCVLFASVNAVAEDPAYTVDTATAILESLLADAKLNLAELEQNWAVNQPILQANIDAVQDQLNNKTEECNNLDVVLAGHRQELEDARKYVAWLVKRIAENEAQITQTLSERCQQNNNFVESLKNDKIALSLVEFLREQIANKETFDFAQRKLFMKKLSSFLAVYRRGDVSELIQLQKQVAEDYEVDVNTDVHGRSNDEIGAGHVDNNVDDLSLDEFQEGQRKGWNELRGELLSILESLETTINNKIQQAQEDEIRASLAAADFKRKLEHEIEIYTAELAKWTANVERLVGVVAQDEANSAQCRAEEVAIGEQLAQAQKDLQVATDEFNHKRANFEEEVAIFEEVISIYAPSVGQQGEDFKARADDYIADGSFDNADYNDREVPDIDLINSF